MSFDPKWLALREPFDHNARRPSRVLMPKLEGARVVDLACGAGSNIRFLAPQLRGVQSWTLVDHDPRLLDTARVLLGMPDSVHDGTPGEWGSHSVTTLQADLRQGFPKVDCDLVVTTALLDLVDAGFVDDLVDWLDGRSILASLTVDGLIQWTPEDPRDAAIHGAFREHQLLDRGFGPSLGVGAAAYLIERLEQAGYTVQTQATPWDIPAHKTRMLQEMAQGIAHAAKETGAEVEAWLSDKLAAIDAGQVSLVVGHVDVFGGRRGIMKSQTDQESR